MRLLLLSALLLTLPLTAKAQTQDVILAMPDGQAILNISATERREVEQDLLVATLSFKSVNKDPRVVQNEINEKMKDALSKAKKEDDVKVSTGSYQVYERTDQRTKETKWHGSQSLTLKSKNSEEILELVGNLQGMGLVSNELSYTLAPDTAVEVQDSLMEAALKQLQTRANRAAKALGKSTAELREVNVNGGNVPYQQVHQARGMMAMADSMEMAAPVASAGESTITLTVNARVILKP
jgi:predicted secreted protein